MDLIRKLNSSLAALDERGRVIAYSAGNDTTGFLRELLQAKPDLHRVAIYPACPYVMADRDKWYAENQPLLRYVRPALAEGKMGQA
jgi:hypothetical protein